MVNNILTPDGVCATVIVNELSEAQVDFLRCCQNLGWGKLEVTVQDGEPAFSKVIEQTHRHKKVH